MFEEKDLQAIAQMMKGLEERMDAKLAPINDRLGQMQEDISDLRTTVTRVAVTQENIVLKSLDALAEGQDLTHQRLKSLAGKNELSELREELILLRSVVAQHTREIEELKAAQ